MMLSPVFEQLKAVDATSLSPPASSKKMDDAAPASPSTPSADATSSSETPPVGGSPGVDPPTLPLGTPRTPDADVAAARAETERLKKYIAGLEAKLRKQQHDGDGGFFDAFYGLANDSLKAVGLASPGGSPASPANFATIKSVTEKLTEALTRVEDENAKLRARLKKCAAMSSSEAAAADAPPTPETFHSAGDGDGDASASVSRRPRADESESAGESESADEGDSSDDASTPVSVEKEVARIERRARESSELADARAENKRLLFELQAARRKIADVEEKLTYWGLEPNASDGGAAAAAAAASAPGDETLVTMETEDASDWSAEATEEDEDEAASGSSDEATERAEGEAEEERVELEMEENGDVADSSFVRDAPCASPRALERDDDATTATAADADANVAASSRARAFLSSAVRAWRTSPRAVKIGAAVAVTAGATYALVRLSKTASRPADSSAATATAAAFEDARNAAEEGVGGVAAAAPPFEAADQRERAAVTAVFVNMLR